MRATTQLEHMLQRLRGLEHYAYQVAHFILQDEVLAAEAAKAALLEISKADKQLEGSAEELRIRTKRITISASITIARSASSIQ
ncbi:hypothetical protein [Paenibacillus prosopidis]|uniref:Uncharacterized protein n=1 Tax=Paenibacillus prosopidis TaxID=630520 RepID=A0A368VYQ4_9BACL|nr:hypothetical protein [Paenibacillus prosopidis]RCW47412.1 hypothetical protein DFP97_10826 [Paenibacillus prosopidis]